MARNGTEFGIKVSGLGDDWFTCQAALPDVLLFPGFTREDTNRDIGDSAIMETYGVGASPSQPPRPSSSSSAERRRTQPTTPSKCTR